MMRYIFLLFFAFHISLGYELTNAEISSVLQLAKNNGKRYLNIVKLDNQDLNVKDTKERFQFMAKEMGSIYIRNAKLIDNIVDIESMKFDQDSLLILASASNMKYWEDYLKMMTYTKIMSSIMVMTGDMNGVRINEMKSWLERITKSSFFYWGYRKTGVTDEMEWYQILTIDNYKQFIINPLVFNQPNGIIIEHHDLQGLHLKDMTLSWAPFYTVSNCKEGNHPNGPNKNCKTEGYLDDTMKLFSKSLNFTWESYNEPENNWGTVPISGPANVSGAWGGVVGYLVRREYQIAISSWIMNEGRLDMFDFVPIIRDRMVLIAKPQRDPIDPGLFIRPFQRDAWYMIGITGTIIIGCLIIPTLLAPKFSRTTSFKMITSIGWLLFMLIEIYYSGALTMFFSTEVSLPFETTREVMKAYDDWKLMMQSGNEVFFVNKALEGDPEYAEFWDRRNKLPDETVFSSVSDGVDLMLNNLIVIHVGESVIRGFMKNNPKKGIGIKLFDRGATEAHNIILVNNSPLGPALRLASRNAMETGVLDPISNTWIGKEVGNERSGFVRTKFVLGAGHVVLIFLLLCTICLSTIIVLFCEIFISKSKNLQNSFQGRLIS